MIRTQLYFPDELYAQAKLYAVLEKMTISEYAREGLEMRVAKAKKKCEKNAGLLPIAGKFTAGARHKNMAVDHNDIYQ